MKLVENADQTLTDTESGTQYYFHYDLGVWATGNGQIPDQTGFPPGPPMLLTVNADGTLYGVHTGLTYQWNATLGGWVDKQGNTWQIQKYFPPAPVSAAAAGTTITVSSTTPGTTSPLLWLGLAAAAWLLFGKKL